MRAKLNEEAPGILSVDLNWEEIQPGLYRFKPSHLANKTAGSSPVFSNEKVAKIEIRPGLFEIVHQKTQTGITSRH